MRKILLFAIIAGLTFGLNAATETRGSAENSVISSPSSARAASTRSVAGPRSVSTIARDSSSVSSRSNVSNATTNRSAVSRSATSARSATTTKTVANRSGTTPTVSARSATTSQKTISARSGTTPTAAAARGTVQKSSKGGASVARAAAAIQTSVKSSSASASSSYDTCKESLSACMDEFCANADSSLRRCYCSSKVAEFQKAYSAIDESKNKLVEFNNNLEKVSLTADEAEYITKATEGELAQTTTDNSTAKELLNSINDLIEGKTNSNSSIDLFAGLDTSSIFDLDYLNSSAYDTAVDTLTGTDLLNETYGLCKTLVADTCSDSELKIALKSYETMISSDCLTVEKDIKTKQLQVKQTTIQANKLLGDTRLSDYKKRNSSDFATCLQNVTNAFTADAVCGENMIKCVDITGKYINASTGDVIFSENFNEIKDLIATVDNKNIKNLYSINKNYNKYLENKKQYATRALSSCEKIADDVWGEFKNNFILTAQQTIDNKYAELKSTCLQAVSECYVDQEKAFSAFDSNVQILFNQNTASAIELICEETTTMCNNIYNFSKSEGDTKVSLENMISDIINTKVTDGCIKAFTQCLQTNCNGSDYSSCLTSDRTSLINSCISYNKAQCPLSSNATPISAKTLDNDSYLSSDNNDILIYNAFKSAVKSMENTINETLTKKCNDLEGLYTSRLSITDTEEATPTTATKIHKSMTGWNYNDSWGYCEYDTSMCREKLEDCISEISSCTNSEYYDLLPPPSNNDKDEVVNTNSQCYQACSDVIETYCESPEVGQSTMIALTSNTATEKTNNETAAAAKETAAAAKSECYASVKYIEGTVDHYSWGGTTGSRMGVNNEQIIGASWDSTTNTCTNCTINLTCNDGRYSTNCWDAKYAEKCGGTGNKQYTCWTVNNGCSSYIEDNSIRSAGTTASSYRWGFE